MYSVQVYNVLVEAMDWAALIFRGYCLYFFYGGFLHRRGRGESRRGFLGLWIFFVAAKQLLDRLSKPLGITDYSSGRVFFKLVLLYGALFLVTVLFYEGKKGFLSFVTVTYAAVSEIGVFFAYSASFLGTWMFALCERGYGHGWFQSVEGYVRALEIVAVLLQLLMDLVLMACMYLALSCIVKTYRRKDYLLHRTELIFLLLPGGTGLLFCMLLRAIMVTVEGQQPLFLYDRYPLLTGIVPLLLVLCLLSMVYSVKLFQDMISLYEEQKRLVILEKQVDSLEEHIRELERVYAGMRAMKHDMKNQLAVAAELVRQGKEGQELQAYLAELNHTLSGLDFPWRTGSAVVDTLLAMKLHEGQERVPGLRFEAERLLIPEKLQIQAMDLSVILGNALDNAIEACEALRARQPEAEAFIRAAAMRRGRFFLLEIENSFAGDLSYRDGEGFPGTTKADRAAHGIGLHSIRTTALKYHGGMDWEAADGVFTLTVLMKNEPA